MQELPFDPIERMRLRANRAQQDSDIAYFFDLLYFGEMLVKLLTLEVVAALQDDRERHRYSLEYRLVRANGIGEWATVLEEALMGPASQHLVVDARDSHRVLTTKHGPGVETWERRTVDSLETTCRVLDSSKTTSKISVSMLSWVKSFVWLRNRTRGHGAVTRSAASDMCESLADAINAVADNAPAFKRAWAHLYQSQSGKYRVTGFGGQRSKFVYLTKESNHSLPNGAYVYLDRPRHVPLLLTDSDLTDFSFPNGAYRNGVFECFSYITDDVQVISGETWRLDAHAHPLSETTATPDLDIVGNVFTNMPERRANYIDRESLETDLYSVILNDRYPVITLQGRGGVGKTSLALQVLHRIAMKSEFTAIIWFSARDIDLLAEGPRVVKADVLTIDDIARDFATLIGRNIRGADRRTFLTQSLSGESQDGPYLFVFDNFETIRDPGDLYAYVNNAVRSPNKILITTRTRNFKADYPIEIGGMNRNEFDRLVAEVSDRLGISSLLDQTYRDELFVESDGHPYITKVLLGEVAKERRRVNPRRAVATRDAMLDALFDRSFAALSVPAQRVFLTLCSWRSSVPRIGLEAVLSRPTNERFPVDLALTELEQASLVEYLGDASGQEAHITVPLAASEFGKKKLVTSPMKMAIEVDLEILRGFGAVTTTEAGRSLKPQMERMARAVAERIEAGRDTAQEFAVIEYIASAYPPAWLILADLQEHQLRDSVAAIRSIGRYLESRPQDTRVWRDLIRLHRAANDPVAEMNARLQLVEVGQSYADAVAAANRLNGLLSRDEIPLDADEKRLVVRKLRSILEARHQEAAATDLSSLAWLCMRDKDTSAAAKWANEGLKLDPDNPHCLRISKLL